MKRTVAKFKAERDYTVDIERESLADGKVVYFASCYQLPGVNAMGDTAEDAVKAFRENLRDWLADAKEHGHDIPAPNKGSYTAVFNLEDTTAVIVPTSSEFEYAG